MADFVTRLFMNSKQFDDSIKKSKKQLQMLQGVGDTVTGAIKGLGVQFLAAAGVMETFETAINSNKVAQDAWNDVCGTAKGVVDDFFTSLTTGDWSIFEDGIINAINLANQYVKSMRSVKTALKLGDVKLSQGEKELNKYENIATNEDNSKEDREKAYADFKKEGDKTIKYINNLKAHVEKEFNQILSSKNIKVDNKKASDLIFEYLDPSTTGNKILQGYKKVWNKLKNAESFAKAPAMNPYEVKAKAEIAGTIPALRKAVDDYVKLYKDIDEARKLELNFGTEEELDLVLDLNNRLIGLEDRAESAKKQIADLDKDFDEAGKLIEKPDKVKKTKTTSSKTTVKKVEIEAAEGSIAKLEKQISEIETKIKYEVDPVKRAELYRELEKLKNQKIEIEFQYKHSTQPPKVERQPVSFTQIAGEHAQANMKDVFGNLKEKTNELIKQKQALADINKEVENLSKQRNDQLYGSIRTTANEVLNLGDTINGLKDIDWDSMNGWEQFSTGVDILFGVIDGIKAVQETWEMFTAIKTALGAKETAQATIEAGVVSAAEAEKAAAVAAGQTAQTAAAIAGGSARTTAYQGEMAAASAAAYAYIPFAAPALAAAQIATFQAMILAAMAVPAFAEGGIVQGTSFFGDKVIARVNSGEMILTKGQQYNLFKLLDGSNINGNPNQITFKLRGSDIYGSLSNYNKKYSKL